MGKTTERYALKMTARIWKKVYELLVKQHQKDPLIKKAITYVKKEACNELRVRGEFMFDCPCCDYSRPSDVYEPGDCDRCPLLGLWGSPGNYDNLETGEIIFGRGIPCTTGVISPYAEVTKKQNSDQFRIKNAALIWNHSEAGYEGWQALKEMNE